ncbi:hypothetical protein CK627_20925 [Aeromonas dhakensis]|nr:hypothetical protein CK627_20925 [Aeromonas dhakensis]
MINGAQQYQIVIAIILNSIYITPWSSWAFCNYMGHFSNDDLIFYYISFTDIALSSREAK